MKAKSHTCLRILFLAAALSAGPTLRPAAGCTIPVFGYALEPWPAEPVVVMLFQRGASNDTVRQFQEILDQAATADPNGANVRTVVVNVDSAMDELATPVWQRHASNALPQAVCLYPDDDREFWSGAPDPKGSEG